MRVQRGVLCTVTTAGPSYNCRAVWRGPQRPLYWLSPQVGEMVAVGQGELSGEGIRRERNTERGGCRTGGIWGVSPWEAGIFRVSWRSEKTQTQNGGSTGLGGGGSVRYVTMVNRGRRFFERGGGGSLRKFPESGRWREFKGT